MLKQPLHTFLTTHGLIGRDREAHFVVAYSGGRDSTALLHSLCMLRQEAGLSFQLTAAYYWHPWRPLQEDLKVVQQNCKALDVQWMMLTPNLTIPKTETAARQDRYQQLARLAYDLDATAVFTAHHQDDQVETILFRILRGTGAEGILGIPEVRQLPIDASHHAVLLVRPLLQQPRTAIDDYIRAHNLSYVEDPTNTEIRMKRNFLRHAVLPRIEEGFPNARQAVLHLSNLMAGEMEIVHNKIDELWLEVYAPETNSLDEVPFSQLAQPYQSRIIRRFLVQAGLEAGHNRVEEVLTFIAGDKRKLNAPSLFSVGTNLYLSIYRNRITIEAPKKTEIAPIPVSVPGQVSHRDLRTTITITPLTAEQRLRPIDYTKLPNNKVYVDLSKFAGQELTFRSRHAGDRIKPLGMSSPIKLKRFLINRCVPRFQRDSIALLATENEVLWAVGIGLSEDVRVKNHPTHVITIHKEA